MLRISIVTGLFFFSVATLSFLTRESTGPAALVKEYYLNQAANLEQEVMALQQLIPGGDEKKMQRQFLKMRRAYKRIETITAYYFDFFDLKLNGPPIPFFEEEEPDMGMQQPAGMQVIEGLLFPKYTATSKERLSGFTEDLLSDTRMMQKTNESFAFNDEYIFDAVMEELYRITTLGITGSDSQLAMNGLAECWAALGGVRTILSFYKENLEQLSADKRKKLQQILDAAEGYLQKNTGFNSFDRMQFILEYLNPVTRLVGEVKKQRGFNDNRSPLYYSTIIKNNTLFTPGAFNVNRYLDDNTTSAEKIEMGRKLFFDTKLSSDGKRSCATCHDPRRAFTDGLATSTALDGHSPLTRNAPTLWNVALQRNLFLDSRSNSLEDQVMQVLNNAREMHGSAQDAAKKIIAFPAYTALYIKAYANATPEMAAANICNAIACYERTLVALDSKFDKQMRGQRLFNSNETSGFNLFMGKAKCGNCHFTPLFSGSKPPRFYFNESEVIGVPEKNNRVTSKLDGDEGRFAATQIPIHKFAFKTPTLRNIALTAPYMHNGVFKTLEEVMDFYNKGGGRGLKIAPTHQTLPFEELRLSPREKKNIILFLKTLTDTTLAAHPA